MLMRLRCEELRERLLRQQPLAVESADTAAVQQELHPLRHVVDARPHRARRGDRIDAGVLNHRDVAV
jgi:hypothetical protein